MNMGQRHLHLSFNAYSFNLYSDKFPYLHENGSININEDTTVTHIYPQQSTEQIHTENPSTNDKDKHGLTAILLGTIIPLCALSVLYSCYAFHKRSKTSFLCYVFYNPHLQ